MDENPYKSPTMPATPSLAWRACRIAILSFLGCTLIAWTCLAYTAGYMDGWHGWHGTGGVGSGVKHWLTGQAD